jgi:hypothetical protein
LLGGQPQYADCHLAMQHLQQLLAAVPQPWMEEAMQVLQHSVATGARQPTCSAEAKALAQRRVTQALGWHAPDGSPVMLGQLTVRAATRLQQAQLQQQMQQRHAAFVRLALAGQPLPARPPDVRCLLRRLWRLRCCNSHKEAFWRLTLDAFPTSERMGSNAPCAAACGTVGPGLEHHFWECPVARAVRGELERCLRLPAPLARAAVWLCAPPAPWVHPGVWGLVCLATIHAMDRGRATAWALGGAANAVVPALVVPRVAVAAFWEVLADFAAVGTPDPRWFDSPLLGPTHPFLAWYAPAGQRLCLARR